MNDRYLFRGKRKDNGKWIYGGIYYQKADEVKEEAVYIIGASLNDVGAAYEVIPETVEQCTGLTDKNGRLIFEGDIVITNIFNTPEIRYTVTYDKQIASFFGVYRQGYAEPFTTFDDDSHCFEIIGNIHDNPELLEAHK